MSIRRMRQLWTRLASGEGYTLLEMLMVVAIIAILATFAAPPMMRAVNQAKDSTSKGELTQIAAGLERYYAASNKYPTSLKELVADGYLRQGTSFKNKFGHFYLYAVNDMANPMAYILADPGRKPRAGDPSLVKSDAPGTEGIIPAGMDPAQGAMQFQNTAGANRLRVYETPQGGTVSVPTLSDWGRPDLMTE